MGFFAILADSSSSAESRHTFEVLKFDINIWCLPALITGYVYYCDVGIHLRATSNVSKVGLTLPFGTIQEELLDLIPRMTNDRKTAGLVFGGNVDLRTGVHSTIVSFGAGQQGRLELRAVDRDKCVLDKSRSDTNFSVWELAISPSLDSGEEAYFRLRFPIRGLGRSWAWRRSALGRKGAIVDVRVCDLREAAIVRGGETYKDRVVTIERLNCFVIVPAGLRTLRKSPDLRYVRLLEGRNWERYLGRATDFFRTGKFVVNYWRQEDVRADHEFRGFLDLELQTAPISWPAALAYSALVLAVIVLFSDPGALKQSVGVTAVVAVWDFVREQLKAVIAGGVVVVTLRWLKRLGAFRRWFQRLRRIYRRVEFWVFNKRADTT